MLPTTWVEFKIVFHNEFKPGDAAQLARTALPNLTQEGSIRGYIVAFRDIMPDLPDMFEEDAIHFFITGSNMKQD